MRPRHPFSECSTFIRETKLNSPPGETALLYIRTGYVTKKIGQTSPLPGALNSLIITLEVNKALEGTPGTDGRKAEVRFSGLRGGAPKETFFAAETGEKFPQSLVIPRNQGVMYFRLQDRTQEKGAFPYLKSFFLPTLQINVRNDVWAQEPPQISVQIDLYDGSTFLENLFPLVPLDVPGKPFTPLYIQKVWTRADGGQTQASPASRNTITLTLQTNFRIFAGDTLTISGLLGAVARKGPIELTRNSSSGVMEPNTVFSSDLCPDQVGTSGEGYWCPGSSKECPCAGDTQRRMILKYTQDVEPCLGSGTIQECMAHKQSQVIFSFHVYNPYIDNGQVAPIITLKLDNNSVHATSKYVLPDTIVKTCVNPGYPVLDANENEIRWYTVAMESDDVKNCAKDDGECVQLPADRTTVVLQSIRQHVCCLPVVRLR